MMLFSSTVKLKAWIKNKSKQTNINPATLYKIYMLERLLERIALSKYRENLVIKGGFLIASMIGLSLRSTGDIDTTVKNIELSRASIMEIMSEITSIDTGDDITFEIQSIRNIMEEREYEDFRMILLARFQIIKEYVQVDFTTGHVIIPHEIEHTYKTMFEDKAFSIMAYNLNTIFSEKVEAILSKNLISTRMRDYYDVYILVSLNRDTLDRDEILRAIRIKANERNTLKDIVNYKEHLRNIENNPEMYQRWNAYASDNSYAEGIEFLDTVHTVRWLFEG